jgi:fatty-acyl-CoA synthase
MLTYRNLNASVAAAVDALEPRADDVLVGWVPLYHDLGLIRFVVDPIFFGLTTHLIEPSLPTLPSWIETISAVGGTITAAPDFAYRLAARLVNPARVDLRRLRLATNGGEAVRTATIRAFETRFNCPGVVRPGYGMAEATLGVSTLPAGAPVDIDASGAVSCGPPLGNIGVRVLDDEDRECDAGERGRVFVSGPAVFAGYLNDTVSTSAVLRDGWFDTGDDGALDARGQLYIHGRRRAMIKRAGASIAPREIEEVVDEISGVRRSAAIGVETHADALTEDIVVVVEIDRRIDAGSQAGLRELIAERVREVIGARPHDVLLVAPAVIPLTGSGKIRYGALKDAWAALRDQVVARE